MRISRIELHNFGSYSGQNIFDIGKTGESKDRSIVLIGGKNGAGKTTLFSGIKLCLYGYKAEGFDGINSFYRKNVRKFFNDIGKYDADFRCYIKVDCYFSNGQSDDFYEIKREWNSKSKLLSDFETVEVKKNGIVMSDEELADFDNFLLNILPPELFNLFFFDGEQIADYFLAEDENRRIKNAFMVLCGFDTLDIMEKQFRRLASTRNKEEDSANLFYVCLDNVRNLSKKIQEEKNVAATLKTKLDQFDYELNDLEKNYKLSGGVSYDEWTNKVLSLKEEERAREEKRNYLKKMANDAIPFIIVHKQLKNLMAQAELEKEKKTFELVQNSLAQLMPEIMKRVYDRLEWQEDSELTELVLEEFEAELINRKLNDANYILNLSDKEFLKLQSLINLCISINKKEIVDAERFISSSLERTQNIRTDMENSSIDGLQAYMDKKNMIVKNRYEVSLIYDECIADITQLEKELDDAQLVLRREEKRFEEELKKHSIKDISDKAIIFLDDLQNKLFEKKIQKVEAFFMEKIKLLARKNKFIDKIEISKDFIVHVYKQVDFNTLKVCERIDEIGSNAYIEEYGMTHCQGILDATQLENLEQFVAAYKDKEEDFSVLQEIDKSRLSKGEKQIFIMALYWAIMQLSKFDVPFVIDTPFARIDSEHRMNITKNFFMDLKGQVFIFSTNEEITPEHYKLIESNVQAKFLLENTENIKTSVIEDCYFGGEDSAV